MIGKNKCCLILYPLNRNKWTACSGFGGRHAPESVVAFDRITQGPRPHGRRRLPSGLHTRFVPQADCRSVDWPGKLLGRSIGWNSGNSGSNRCKGRRSTNARRSGRGLGYPDPAPASCLTEREAISLPFFGYSYAFSKVIFVGISPHILPSSNLPAFFLWSPPHCLKKNGTLAFKHWSRTPFTHSSSK